MSAPKFAKDGNVRFPNPPIVFVNPVASILENLSLSTLTAPEAS